MTQIRAFGRLGAMKTAGKILGALLVFALVLGLTLWGVRAYNLHRYAIPSGDGNSMTTHLEATLRAHGGEEVRGDYLRGIYYAPSAPQHAGTIITFGGSEGSAADFQARALSEQGYHAVALYFFGQDGQQRTLSQVPLDFFDEALAWIDAREELAGGPLTVIGTSKGAELTANLAARYPEIDNIVLYTPGDHTYSGLSFDSREQASSFTWRGAEVPFAAFPSDFRIMGPMMFRMALGLPVSYLATYEAAAASADPASRIDLSGFSGHGLLFAGDQDAMWQAATAARNLEATNPRLEAVVYPGAGHLFSEDVAAAIGPSWKTMLGGTIEGNRQASRESGALLRERLAEWHPSPTQG
ncbi:alpha/beta fold hydrolase [Corynebacterium testudinoris]|uniref:Lysophospholipase n=2 Tax=Corynebacterium testudinoris TaxID=136857 RepID=A0A0G3H364_9CORY|nr:alpha/beta fold hydrolase [Corynebacterium testudinoris]AKK07846.1 lysophospholipase [Corynebacterium testudinoris]